MKNYIPLITLLTVTIIVGGLWLAVGGTALAIGFGVLVGLCILLSTFGAGLWVAKQLMASGADIALRAQESDDRRDNVQINALSGLVKEVYRAAQQNAAKSQGSLPQYPALPSLPSGDVVDGNFIIRGLAEDDEVKQ